MPSFNSAASSGRISVYAEQPAMRLRDLIYGLHEENLQACEVVARLDPAIADELHAIAAHRHIGVADFVAQALMELALDHADQMWQTAVQLRPGLRTAAETAELGQILLRAMRRHLQAEVSIGCDKTRQRKSRRQHRIGHAYISV